MCNNNINNSITDNIFFLLSIKFGAQFYEMYAYNKKKKGKKNIPNLVNY